MTEGIRSERIDPGKNIPTRMPTPVRGIVGSAAILMLIVLIPGVGCVPKHLPDFDNRVTLTNPDRLIALIGKKVRIVDVTPPYEPSKDPDVIIVPLNSGFEARYRILKLIHGKYNGEMIDFMAFDHFGFPQFARYDVVMLYLEEEDGELIHVKYQYDRVYPTADGRWAGCGDPYFGRWTDAKLDRHSLQKIEFDPPVVLHPSDYLYSKEDLPDYEEKELAENRAKVAQYFSEPVFQVNGDRAYCQMGLYAEEIFQIRNERQFIPARREDMCADQLGIDRYSRTPEEFRAVLRCSEEMKAHGLP